jgi:hypothetical protein
MCLDLPDKPEATHDHTEPDLCGPVGDPDPVQEYRKQAQARRARAPDIDACHLAWQVAKEMAARGYSPDALRQALLAGRPPRPDDAAGAVQDEVTRLIDEVMQLPDVLVSRKLVLGPNAEFGLGF